MALSDRDTAINYLGELFLVGAYQTPFLNMIGGMGGSRAKKTTSMLFPVAQPYTLGSAAVPGFTEDALVAANTATTFARNQDINTVMIFKQDVEVSYLKQAAYGEIGGISVAGDQPVKDEFAFQKMASLKKMAIDMDLAFLTGTYAAAVNSSTAAQTKGAITACATNTVAAGTAALTKTHFNTLLRSMAGNGAVFSDMVCFANAFQKQAITALYGYAPEDRSVGGMNIKQIETDFCMLGVVWAPNMPAGSLLIADMSVMYPVFLPYEGQAVWYEDLARVAGAKKGQYISFAGIDFGPEEYHGTITGLTTS